jgi:hypothetical protein
MRLMQRVRDSIKNDCFPEFAKQFIRNYYANSKGAKESTNEDNKKPFTKQELNNNQYKIPDWVVNALNAVNINVLED